MQISYYPLVVSEQGFIPALMFLAQLPGVRKICEIGGGANPALNLAFVQFLLVQRRKTAFATMRSMGATRADLAASVWLDALVLSMPAAVLGIIAALGLAHLSESLLLSDFAALPLRPEYLFRFPDWLFPFGFFYAAAAAISGSLPPAYKAASINPVKILKG